MVNTDIEIGSVIDVGHNHYYRVMAPNRIQPEYLVVAVNPHHMSDLPGSETVFTSKFLARGNLCWARDQWAAKIIAYNDDKRRAALCAREFGESYGSRLPEVGRIDFAKTLTPKSK